MKSQYKDFIGIYSDVFPDGFCQHMIEEFERLLHTGAVYNRQETEGCSKRFKEDEFTFLNYKNHTPTPYNVVGSDEYENKEWPAKELFFAGLQKCYDAYMHEYDALQTLNVRCTNIKIQKTNPGGGYHVWHCEVGAEDGQGRIVTYALYLNTIKDAGETEYLYQQFRVPPVENNLVLWPATYTHPHRGNVVYGDTSKYIITGWFYLE